MKEHESLNGDEETKHYALEELTLQSSIIDYYVVNLGISSEKVEINKNNVQQQSNKIGNERPHVLHTLTSWS